MIPTCEGVGCGVPPYWHSLVFVCTYDWLAYIMEYGMGSCQLLPTHRIYQCMSHPEVGQEAVY